MVGAKPVFRAHASVEGDVEVADDGAFLDIDTTQDYRRFVGALDSLPPR
jgi:CTP:molybdopterin cytidylyltransferase MocA